jgi:hypothetical protein
VISFRVKNTNDAPVLNFVSPQYAVVGNAFFARINATDPDNDPLAFYADTGLFNMSHDGAINFIPGIAQAGTYFIDVLATDGNLNDTKTLNLIIEESTNAPKILSAPDEIFTYPFKHFEINVTACDPDTDAGCII